MPPRPDRATILYRFARTVPEANAPLCEECELGGSVTAVFTPGSSVVASWLETARPQDGQKRTSSRDTAPQLEQTAMRWIVTGWSSDPENGLCGHFLARQGTEGSLTETLPSTKTQLFLSTCAPWSGFFSKLSSLVSIYFLRNLIPPSLRQTSSPQIGVLPLCVRQKSVFGFAPSP